MTGYELARFFDASTAWVWSAPHSNIYPALRKMEAEGLQTIQGQALDVAEGAQEQLQGSGLRVGPLLAGPAGGAVDEFLRQAMAHRAPTVREPAVSPSPQPGVGAGPPVVGVMASPVFGAGKI